jgi:hypothetical protein
MLIGLREMLDLRHQRLRELEAEHFMASLAVEEEPRDKKATQDIAELERRILHHREVIITMAESLDKPESPAEEKPADQADRSAGADA